MKLTGLNICSFDPFDSFGNPKNTKYRVGNTSSSFNSFLVKSPLSFDATNSSVLSSTLSSTTINLTVNSKDNRMIVFQFASITPNIVTPITSVKIGTFAFTQAVANSQNSNQDHSELWYLLDAGGIATGSNTITVTFNGSLSLTGAIGVTSFYGVNQSSPIGQTGSNFSSSGTSFTVALTGLLTNSFIVDTLFVSAEFSRPILSPTDVQDWNVDATGNGSAGSEHKALPTSSYTMTWTKTSGGTVNFWVMSAMEIKQA